MKRFFGFLCAALLLWGCLGTAMAQESATEAQRLSNLFRTAEWRLHRGMTVAELDTFIADDSYAPLEKTDRGDGVIEYRALPYAALRVKGDPIEEARLVAECAEHGVEMELPFVVYPAYGYEGEVAFSKALKATKHDYPTPEADAWKTWLGENGPCFRLAHENMSDLQQAYLDYMLLVQAIAPGTPAKDVRAIGNALVDDGWLGSCVSHTPNSSALSFQSFPIEGEADFTLRFVSMDGRLVNSGILFLVPSDHNTRIGGLLNLNTNVDWAAAE